ncbi:hypothetical protein JST99_01690 [Candidatus Dependentiae bacterium]|nr:hypothetical protein [Candidatus Dependentiae bacterium]MCC7414696.1 hypothetical protein [Campylobacterota bacterium]
MIKNRIFACCMALTGSLLCIGSIKGSARHIPGPLIQPIAEYDDLRSAVQIRYTESVSLFKHDPKDYDFSSIAVSNDSRDPIVRVTNWYNSAAGEKRSSTYSFHANSSLTPSPSAILFSSIELPSEEHQKNCTTENRNRFGSAIVPATSSASLCLKQALLFVANSSGCATYRIKKGEQPVVTEAIDQALNLPKSSTEQSLLHN